MGADNHPTTVPSNAQTADEETIFVVERHDDGYYGPHRVRVAGTHESARQVAREEMVNHYSEFWPARPRTRDADDGLVRETWFGFVKRGWVTIREQPLE